MWNLLTALYQFCGISSWRMTLPSFGPRYWVVTCTESVFSRHTYTNIHARFFVYKKHTQSLSLFFLITVTSSPLAMGFTARTIIVPSLVCKNQDVRKGLQNVTFIIVRARSTHQYQHQHQVKKPDQIDQAGGVAILQQQ